MTQLDASERRSLLPRILAIIGALVVLGTVGYRLIEGWSWLDSLYMTLMVLTTVGFGEVRPLGAGGKLFTSALMVVGIGLMLYSISLLAEIEIGAFADPRRARKRKERRVRELQGHTVVCGFGQVGEAVCAALHEEGKAFVVVDASRERARLAEERGYLSIEGDATQDDTLRRAGVTRAANLVSVLSSDPANLYVLLSALSLRPELTTIARASNEDAAEKMRRAGAGEIINPYRISAARVANLLLRPTLVQLLDALRFGEVDYRIEEVAVEGDLVHSSVQDVGRRSGALVVAVRRGEQVRRPHPDDKLERGDVLLLIGAAEELGRLT